MTHFVVHLVYEFPLKGYEYFGAHIDAENNFVMRQWAPGAQEMWLMGDFNNWNKFQNPFEKLEFGKWQIKLPPNTVEHMSRYKMGIFELNYEPKNVFFSG